jgi:zinc protease
MFVIRATAQPGQDLNELEYYLDQELNRLLKKGINKSELELAQTSYETGFVRGLQRVGGFGGKADRLNRYNVFTGDPGFLPKDLERYRQVTTKDLMGYAKQYLTLDRRAILHIVPQGSFEAGGVAVDRSQMPEGGSKPDFTPPTILTSTLSNGLELYLVEKHELPLVQMSLLIKSGWAFDPGDKPGTAALAGELLDEGTTSRNAIEIAEEARRLGAQLGTGSFFDGTIVNLNVLKRNLEESLDLVADLVLNPTFPEEEIERQRQIYLGRIQQESAQPIVTAIKILQKQVFGEGHPYAQPYTGSGTEASLQALAREDLVRFHADHFLPNNAAVVIAGDLTLTEAKENLERVFKIWQPGTVPRRMVPEAIMEEGSRVCVVHRPGAQQSVIIAGHLSMTRNNPDFQTFQVMNQSLGGQFTARVNMNLREDKGYTYGARTQLASFREAGVFFCMAPVHTEYTKESLVEILKELTEVKGVRPLTFEEIKDAKSNLTMGFPQLFETYGGITNEMYELVMYDLPLNDWQTYMGRVNGVDGDDISEVLKTHLNPENLVFIIIGDWEEIEEGVRELDLGTIVMMDAGEL